MVMFVLHNPDLLDEVLEAWRDEGVGGVTFVESSGIYRRQARHQRVPLRFGFEQLAQRDERGSYTLFALVDSDDVIERCSRAVEDVVGDLREPNTGILTAWPVPYVRGLPKSSDAET